VAKVRSFCHQSKFNPIVHDTLFLIQNASFLSFLLYGLLSLIFLIFIANLIHIINLPILNILIDKLFKLYPAQDHGDSHKTYEKSNFCKEKYVKYMSFYKVYIFQKNYILNSSFDVMQISRLSVQFCAPALTKADKEINIT